MSKNHEIIAFTYGDANLLSTWSNVPYFFTSALEKKGCLVHRVNIKKYPFIQKVFNRTVRLFNKDSAVEFSFTPLGAKIANRAMKKAIKKYPDADLLIAINFSYSPASISDKKNVILSDWSFEYLIRHFKGREPSKREQREIERQDREIEKSDYVITLFPQIKDDMEKYYSNPNIYYLGNYINCDPKEAEHVDIDEKEKSKRILFIGEKKYKDNALKIMQALDVINQTRPDKIRFDIIGMEETDFDELPSFVNCFGYLNKSNKEENKVFYQLLKGAKFIINTSSGWGGWSSIVEAMYLYTPIITSPYGDFVKEFGESINFGIYCMDNEIETIAQAIKVIMDANSEGYKQMCKNAHEAVKDNSWDSYADRLLKLIDEE